MTAQQAQELSGDARLGKILAEWLEAVERGDAPDPQEYLRRYPEFADLLPQHFADWENFPRAPAPRAPADVAATIDSGGTFTEHATLPRRLGDYELLREVGRGGMGVIFEARQLSLERRVALKMLPWAATMNARQLQRFHNESRAAASLDHPHIVPVYNVGSENGVHYFAMRFIDGQTLANVIEAERGKNGDGQAADGVQTQSAALQTPAQSLVSTVDAPLAPRPSSLDSRSFLASRPAFRRAAEWGIQAAEALDYAHHMGVVHRDIKPANLMIDAAGHLWVTDFGLARTTADTALTQTGDLLGTLRYMSPEQALAKHGLVDHRTDVYALGTTLYELLTGQPAVEGHDRPEILRNLADNDPRLPSEWNPAIPSDLETIVLKALSKEPAGRYATALEMADDLGRFLENRPIRARRPTSVERIAKWWRRQCALVMTAIGLLLSLLIILAVMLLVVTGDRDEKARALAERDQALRDKDAALFEANKALKEKSATLTEFEKAPNEKKIGPGPKPGRANLKGDGPGQIEQTPPASGERTRTCP